MIELSIDMRERGIINHFSGMNFEGRVQIKQKSLDIGDIIISSSDGKGALVFERKTHADMASSITSGRWREQAQRLKAAYPCDRVSVILEGPGFSWRMKGKKFTNITTKSYNASLTCTLFRENFKLVQCKDTADTCAFIELMVDRVLDKPEFYFASSSQQPYEPNTVKTKKIENIDTRTSFVMQLCCIPHVSTKKANGIIDVLNVTSMSDLLASLDTSPDPIAELCRVPKIGDFAAKIIIEYLGIRG